MDGHPVFVQPLAPRRPAGLLVEEPPGPLDGVLLDLGAPHLATVLAREHPPFDGRALRWMRTTGAGTDEVRVVVARGSYFDMLATCDAIRAEGADGPGRRRAAAVAGDPVVSGAGRCAALGVSVLLTYPGPRTRQFVLGRRAMSLAMDPGRWHVAPSGMVEPCDDADPLVESVRAELAEELGVVLTAEQIEGSGTVLGLVHDRTRLRPDVVVRLDLDGPVPEFAPTEAEFTELRLHDVSDTFWAGHPPGTLTAAAAGAVELLLRQA